MASEGLHESPGDLDDAVVDRHRAIRSIMEELEAIDWYDQRVSATGDDSLAEVLAHNRDEEKEHAAMAIEWLRRHDPTLDRHLRTYLFTEGSIVAEEQEVDDTDFDADADGDADGGSLRIGSLRSNETSKEFR